MMSSQRGLALIEVLIASAIGLVVMLVFATQIETQLSNMAFLEDKLSQISLETEMKAYLLTPNCLRTFNGMTPRSNPQPITVRNLSNEPFIANGSVFDQLNVTRVTFSSPAPIPPRTIGMVEVKVETDRQRQGGGPRTLKPIVLKLSVRTNAAGQVDACPAAGVSEVQIYECLARRNSSCSVSTPAAKVYDFCALHRVEGNGEDGGDPDSDHCRIESSGPGIWTLNNRRDNDNDRTCGMICIRF